VTDLHRCFAGSNTPMLTEALEGQPILVSYADVRPGGGRERWFRNTLRPMLERKAFSFVMLDSGAFTVISQGITIDVDAYAAFAADHAELFDVVVNLDSIAGDLDESRRNLETLRAAGVEAMPVFHEGETWDELETMLERSDYIGLGFARVEGGRMANPLADRREWLAQAFAKIGGRAKVHGFAMTRHALEVPFYSVDSSTWIAEYRGLRKQTPGAIFEGTHGIGGELALRLKAATMPELLELVVDSYATRAAAEPSAMDDQIERDSRGQARTVFRRFGGAALADRLEALGF